MFDDRLVFESPGRQPGQVKPENIRHTHFSRNPKIAAFLKTCHYVREFGEGVDRICRELEVNGAGNPSFHTNEFILKITVRKVTESEQKPNRNRTEELPENGVRVAEKLPERDKKVAENHPKVAENRSKVAEKLPEKLTENINKITEKASAQGETLTANRIKILELMMEDPYISRADLAKIIGIRETSVYRNIEMMRGKFLRRVGPDKGDFWEIIKDE